MDCEISLMSEVSTLPGDVVAVDEGTSEFSQYLRALKPV